MASKSKEIPSNADVDLVTKSRNSKFSTYHPDQRPETDGQQFPEDAASLVVQELGEPKPGASTVTKVVNKDS